jgi:hypothetical protein
MDVVGSRYEAVPQTVIDGEIRGFQIDAQGRLVVIGPTADSNAFLYAPIGVSGIYEAVLPTYTTGDVATVHMDVNGRTFVLDDQSLAVLNLINAKLNSLGQKVMAASVPVVIASDQSAIPVTQSGVWNITDITGTISLPTGASTSALQTTGNTSLSSIDGKLNSLGQKLMAASVPVVIASDQSAVPASQSGVWTVQPGNTANTTPWLVKTAGKVIANAPVRNDYTSVNVTTAAYVQLVAALSLAATEVEIYDSSGRSLFLALGAAAAEVDQILIPFGGNGRIPLSIPAGTRVSIKAVSGNATTGEINVNFYNG